MFAWLRRTKRHVSTRHCSKPMIETESIISSAKPRPLILIHMNFFVTFTLLHVHSQDLEVSPGKYLLRITFKNAVSTSYCRFKYCMLQQTDNNNNQTRFVTNNTTFFIVLVPKYSLVTYKIDTWRTIDEVKCVALQMSFSLCFNFCFHCSASFDCSASRKFIGAPVAESENSEIPTDWRLESSSSCSLSTGHPSGRSGKSIFSPWKWVY